MPARAGRTTDQWVERWLSQPRFAVYIDAIAGDRDAALELYEWNAYVSTAFGHDLAHLEVGLRNAYDRALTTHLDLPRHWTACGERVFAPVPRTPQAGRSRQGHGQRQAPRVAGMIDRQLGAHIETQTMVTALLSERPMPTP